MRDQSRLAIEGYLHRDHAAPGQKLQEPQILPVGSAGTLFLDESAIRHLELVESSDPAGQGPTLLSLLDQTVTPMGCRLLRWWILHPSCQKQDINDRLDQVDDFLQGAHQRDGLRSCLQEVSDIERILVRTQAGSVSPRDLAALRHSLKKIPDIQDNLNQLSDQVMASHFTGLMDSLTPPPALLTLLDSKLQPEPPAKIVDGGVICSGVNAELDELREIKRSGRKWIVALEAEEREKTGITNLKIGYNDVFGYFLEVSKSHLSKVPSDWIRKQTLTNAERYITPDLKAQEEKILGAQDKILALETALYQDLIAEVAAYSPHLGQISQSLSHLDAVSALAQVAAEQGFVRPTIEDSSRLFIEKGRHPVIEKKIGRDRFIPNDCALGGDQKQISILTGPNMAGKSTYLRQNALIVIMAQMGSFVPAESATIGLVDRIFTRIGATDRLSQGQSTFMVEMAEVATLLLNATEKSLLVLDEVGRGTSTYDGVSIAWAVIDFLSKTKGARTLFATHYFELTQLADLLPNVKNAHATAKEWPGEDGRRQVVFLYQIQDGPADRSYGIHVAEMAGLPESCIDRARDILRQLESGTHQLKEDDTPQPSQPQLEMFGEHPVVKELKDMKIDQCTPLEALNILSKLKRSIEED